MINKNSVLFKLYSSVKDQKASFAFSKKLNLNALNPKKVPTQTFANAEKQKYCDRLYVWGYAGVGALGTRKNFHSKNAISLKVNFLN